MLTGAFGAFLGVVMLSAPAHAQDDGVTPPRTGAEEPVSRMLSLDGWMGGGIQGRGASESGAIGIGAVFLVRPSWLTVGAGAEFGGEVFGSTQEKLGALGGTTLEAAPWLRIDALAEFGAHFEQATTGLDIIGSSAIVGGDRSVTVPYAGVRLSPAFLIGRGEGPRFLLGTWINARADLSNATARYTVESCNDGFFGSYACSQSEESLDVGGRELSMGVRIGSEFGRAVH
jgi:hypothetical protein